MNTSYQTPNHKALTTIVHRTAAFLLGDFCHAEDLFSGRSTNGYVYSRISNPTVEVLERTLVELEGGKAAVATASGQAAVHLALLPFLLPGKNIVVSSKLYGGTVDLLNYYEDFYQVGIRWVDPTDARDVKSVVDTDTTAIFVESIANPDGTIPDFAELKRISRTYKVPFVVDNTLASPYLFRPIEHGANIVVHSTTKYLNGHGTAVGGIVVDACTFPWGADERFPVLTKPRRGEQFSLSCQFKENAYAVLLRQNLARLGPCSSPDKAALTSTGIETLHSRMKDHVKNAQIVAEFLAASPLVTEVRYAGLNTDPNFERVQKYMRKGAGAVMLVTFEGGEKAAAQVLNRLQVFSHSTSMGQTNSLVIHPATTTHAKCSKAQQENAGIYPGTLRLAIGLEEPERLIADLKQAIAILPRQSLE